MWCTCDQGVWGVCVVVTIRRKLLQCFVYSVGEREREGTRDRDDKSRLQNANNSDLF